MSIIRLQNLRYYKPFDLKMSYSDDSYLSSVSHSRPMYLLDFFFPVTCVVAEECWCVWQNLWSCVTFLNLLQYSYSFWDEWLHCCDKCYQYRSLQTPRCCTCPYSSCSVSGIQWLGVLGARRAQKCVWSRGPVRKIKWIVQVLAYAESYNKGF